MNREQLVVSMDLLVVTLGTPKLRCRVCTIGEGREYYFKSAVYVRKFASGAEPFGPASTYDNLFECPEICAPRGGTQWPLRTAPLSVFVFWR